MEDKEKFREKFLHYVDAIDDLLDDMSKDPDEHLLVISILFNQKLKQVAEVVIHLAEENEDDLEAINDGAAGIFNRVDEYIDLIKKQNELCKKHSHVFHGSEGKLQ